MYERCSICDAQYDVAYEADRGHVDGWCGSCSARGWDAMPVARPSARENENIAIDRREAALAHARMRMERADAIAPYRGTFTIADPDAEPKTIVCSSCLAVEPVSHAIPTTTRRYICEACFLHEAGSDELPW